MKQTFYVTTPIYYVNAEPHIGHAYTTILADVLSRFERLAGNPTFFLTGTDEHGQKVQQAAQKMGTTPQQHADETVVRFLDLWKRLGITYDDFIRTTEDRHKSIVQQILQKLYDEDKIYRAEYDGWYCVTCERFYTERDLNEGKCPEPGCGRVVDRITESNYFFRMSNYQTWLIQHINDNPKFIQPDFRRNETLGFLKQKLNDLCISRPKNRLSWGIELPFDSDYVTYVWFDALVNYISAIGYLSDDAKFRKWWPASYHLIGKDILTTHTVYWPTMLKAMGLPMPTTVFAHGWWLAGESKMSKTAGNVVNPMEFAEKYGADAFRYFLLAEMVPGQDAAFTEAAFIRRYNSDLANDLGNLFSRVAKMIASHCDGLVPEPSDAGPDEKILAETVLASAAAMSAAVKGMRPDLGIAAVMNAVRETNRYLEKSQPWLLSKEGRMQELGTVLYSAAEGLRIISSLLYPIMPTKVAEMRVALGMEGEESEAKAFEQWGVLKPGARIGSKPMLFPRIQELPAAGAETRTECPPKRCTEHKDEKMIEYSEFRKMDLRTAKVIAAEKVDGADKLLRLEIDLGGERRQIVAGIAQHYEPADVVGKTIVVVANLQPARIRGIESNGMLLAASPENGPLRLLTVDGDTPAGITVK